MTQLSEEETTMGSNCPKCGGPRVHRKAPMRGWFCNTCNNTGRRKWYGTEKGLKTVMLGSAKQRAKLNGLIFDLTVDDIVIPELCPVLGIPLKSGTRENHWNAPTLDRIFLDKGYVKGNVVVISWRANFIRSNATLDELRKVLAYSEEITSCKFVVTPRPAAGGTFLPFRRILSETAVA
jgi:ribosomal protein L37AE/L43A